MCTAADAPFVPAPEQSLRCPLWLLQATYEKLLTEVPKYKMITPSVLSDRLRVRFVEAVHFAPARRYTSRIAAWQGTVGCGVLWVALPRGALAF